MASQLDIINGALIELGQTPLQNLSGNNVSTTATVARYEPTYRDLLAKAAWRFAVKKIDLSRDVTDPLNEWNYRYQLPGAYLRILGCFPPQQYEIYQDYLYSNASAISLEYVEQVTESFLSAPFVRLFEFELAARCCMQITGDQGLKQSMEQNARFQFAAALAADSQARPNQRFRSSPFVEVRGG